MTLSTYIALLTVLKLSLLILFFFNDKKVGFAHKFFVFYKVITIFCTFIYVLMQEQSNIDDYYQYWGISGGYIDDFVLYSSGFILVYMFLAYTTRNFNQFQLSTSFVKHRFICLKVSFLLLISAICKIYLISTGVWFFFDTGKDVEISGFTNIARIVSGLEFVTFFIAFHFLINKKNTVLFVIVSIFIISAIYFSVISGSKERIILAVIPLVYFLWGKYKKKSLLLIIPVFLMFPVLDNFIKFVRVSFTNGHELVNILNDYEYTTHGTDRLLLNGTLNRFNYNIPGAKLIQTIESNKNFQYVPSYFDSVIVLIPRFLWPEKQNYGLLPNYFGRRTGMINSRDYSTSIGFTPIGESLLFHGYFGLFLGPVWAFFCMSLIPFLLKYVKHLSFTVPLYIYLSIYIGKQDWFFLIPTSIIQILLISSIYFSIFFISNNKSKLKSYE